MANEFVIKNGYFSQGNSNITGSLTVSNGITSSLFGTSSWANNSITASYILNAVSASRAVTASYFFTSSVTSASFATNAISASRSQTASFVTPLTQNVQITGSLIISASGTTNDLLIGTNKLFVSASGNIGIGTTNPTIKLDVQESTGTGNQIVGRFLAGTNTNGSAGGITLGSTQTQAGYIYGVQTATSTGDLVFGNQYLGSYAERMRILGNGNVGIDTTNPLAKLHVSGTAMIGSSITNISLGIATDTFTGKYSTFTVNQHGDFTIGSNLKIDSDRQLYTNNNHPTMTGAAIILCGNNNPDLGTNTIAFYAEKQDPTTAGTIVSASTADMVVKAAGFVGIGTTSPTQKLTVAGNIFANAGNDEGFKLNGGLSIYRLTGDDLGFFTANNERMRITSTGNVGIGTTSPNAILDVNGSSIISGSLNHGALSKTIGYYSHAEGYNTNAFRDYSHAEGSITYAGGVASHAEGWLTSASGQYSHAEGYGVGGEGGYLIASGFASHAEGISTRAAATGSHSEGSYTYAGGIGSHAEGSSTSANGSYSHAEGSNTVADGTAAHAEGSGTDAVGASSHAEGEGTLSSGSFSHAEGGGSIASGSYSHAEGYLTRAEGSYSHAEGLGTIAFGGGSHTEGWDTSASGSYSHAEGAHAIATGFASHAEGEAWANGYASHAEGYSSALGMYSHAEGAGTIAFGTGSHAEGYFTSASGDYSHTEGSGSIARGYVSHAEGTNAIAFGTGSHAEGLRTIASGSYSHAEGQNNIARGTGSHAEGFSTVTSGNYSHAEGWLTVAAGNYSHAEGWLTISSGSYSHAEGYGSIALGNYSHAEGGYYNDPGGSDIPGGTAIGSGSHAEGGATISSGSYSHAEGFGTIARGDVSHTSGLFTVADGPYQSVIGAYNISSSFHSAFIIGNGNINTGARSNLVFASGSAVQITGSLLVSTGNVGIGTPSPSTKLHIVNGNQTILLASGSNTSGYTLSIGVNDDGVNITNNSTARGYNFKAQIGSTPNQNLFTIASTTGNIQSLGTITTDQNYTGTNFLGPIAIGNGNEIWLNSGSGTGQLYINYRGFNASTAQFRNTFIGNGKAGTIALFDGTTSRLGLGTASPTHQLTLTLDQGAKPSTNTWTITSDSRIKENIIEADYNVCYDIVKNLPLKRYTWKQEAYTNEQVSDRSKLGWIAQDVETIFPKAVEIQPFSGSGDFYIEDCRNLNSDQIYAAMYGTIKKLISDNESLKLELQSIKTHLGL